jgi:hypothetical protein
LGLLVELDECNAEDDVTRRFTHVHVPSEEDCYMLLDFTISTKSPYYNDVFSILSRALKSFPRLAYNNTWT